MATVWNNLLPDLEEQLALGKDRRIQEVFEGRVSDRLDLIVYWYNEYVEENLADAEFSLTPNLLDACGLSSLVALAQSNNAEGELSREALLALTEQLVADVERYKTCAQRELADILCCSDSASEDLEYVPADEALQRYCASFQCYKGSWCDRDHAVGDCPCLTYEQLRAHWREEHSDDAWLSADEDDRWGTMVVEVPNFWPSPHSVPSIGKRALEAVGIPLDTPR